MSDNNNIVELPIKKRAPNPRPRYFFSVLALHRRYYVGPRRHGIYQHPSDFLASSGTVCAWGETKRDAIRHLDELMTANERRA